MSPHQPYQGDTPWEGWEEWPEDQPYAPVVWPRFPNGAAWPRRPPPGWPANVQYPPPPGHDIYRAIDEAWPHGMSIHHQEFPGGYVDDGLPGPQISDTWRRLPSSVRFKLLRDFRIQILSYNTNDQAVPIVMWAVAGALFGFEFFGLSLVVSLMLEGNIAGAMYILDQHSSNAEMEEYLNRPMQNVPHDSDQVPPYPEDGKYYYWDSGTNRWVEEKVPKLPKHLEQYGEQFKIKWSRKLRKFVLEDSSTTPPTYYHYYPRNPGGVDWWVPGQYWYVPVPSPHPLIPGGYTPSLPRTPTLRDIPDPPAMQPGGYRFRNF